MQIIFIIPVMLAVFILIRHARERALARHRLRYADRVAHTTRHTILRDHVHIRDDNLSQHRYGDDYVSFDYGDKSAPSANGNDETDADSSGYWRR